jgi:LuxR family maltose regulon positive regulatory protein
MTVQRWIGALHCDQQTADALLQCAGYASIDSDQTLPLPPSLETGAVPAKEARQVTEETTDPSFPSEVLPLVLNSKLQAARLHPSLLPRPHLLKRLEDSLYDKLTLISAPAGFGKTTLASQWIAQMRQSQSQMPLAWLSLDPDDNDPIRFWCYVVMACQPFLADRGHAALALLRPGASFTPPSLFPALRTLLNELAALPQRGILILEDYHVIRNPEIHETFTFVLDHLPTLFHLIVITRVDPPLPLARWRVHGELCELQADDLRFSREETATYLSQALSTGLSEESINSLDRRLEGWVAGLHLVTLALHERKTKPEVDHFLSDFSGSHRHILEFFVTEVLCRQSEKVQNFLLQTSVLSCVSGSLCNAVIERNDGQHLLETVERSGLFLQALDGSGQWYRYHPLFAEALRAEARHRFGEDALHSWCRRASLWYEQQRIFPKAVDMALHAQEFERVANLIEQYLLKPYYAYDETNEYHTLRRWISSLPEQVVGQHPRLCVHVALLSLFPRKGRSDCRPSTLAEIERLLQWAEDAWQAEGNRCERGTILTVYALVSGEQANLDRASQFAREALACLSEHEAQWRGCCLRILGIEALLSGRVQAASEHLQQAWTCFQIAENNSGERATQLALAEACLHQGRLRQAAELYHVVLATAGEDRFDTGKAQLGLARLSYAWNDLEHAEQEAQGVLAVSTQLADEALQVQASFILVAIEQARGQIAAAQQRLHALLARLPGTLKPSLLLYRQVLAQQARLCLAVGDLPTAEHWLLSRSKQQELLPRLQQEQEDLIAARLLIAQGKTEEALRLLEACQRGAQQMEWTRSSLQILLLQALAYFAHQSRPRAFSLLRQVLGLALPEGEQRLFLDEGEPMQILLRTGLPALDGDLVEPYAHTLLHAFAQSPLDEQQAAGPGRWLIASPKSDLLSPQERRVLALLLTGCSNPEMAQMLVVSINTVKTHVRSIYQKLNVKNRRQVRQLLGR